MTWDPGDISPNHTSNLEQIKVADQREAMDKTMKKKIALHTIILNLKKKGRTVFREKSLIKIYKRIT